MATEERAARVFESLSHTLRKKLPLSIVKVSRSLSTVFSRTVYDPNDMKLVLAEFESNSECGKGQTSDETLNQLQEVLDDKNLERGSVFLILSQKTALESRPVNPDSDGLICRTSAESSDVDFEPWVVPLNDGDSANEQDNLGSDGSEDEHEAPMDRSCGDNDDEDKRWFACSGSDDSASGEPEYVCGQLDLPEGVQSVSIPGNFEEIRSGCFAEYENPLRVTFSWPSSLKRIGSEAFMLSCLIEVHIPDSVEVLSDKCFSGCENLVRVTFGASSSLKRIGREAFSESGLREIHIPDSVERLYAQCFYCCSDLSIVTFGKSSSLKRIGLEAFSDSDLREIHIPASVEKLSKNCFARCYNLSIVTFDESSSLKWISGEAFSLCDMTEIHIPDSVEILHGKCFGACRSLSRVTFGKCPSLKRIGEQAFSLSDMREVHIPDSVVEIGDECFANSENLSVVTFGESSSLKHIGCEAFRGIPLREIHIPRSVRSIGGKCFAECKMLSVVTFGKPSSLDVEEVGFDLFSGCDNLTERDIDKPDNVEGLSMRFF